MYEIRRIRSSEVEEALALAWEVFLEFEAPDYRPEGTEAFRRDIVENEQFITMCCQGIVPIYAAFLQEESGEEVWDGSDGRRAGQQADQVRGRMMGIIGMRSETHINLVFTRKEYHRKGMGRALLGCFLDYAAGHGYEYVQVKTVQKGHYPEYDRTNAFYEAVGFRELECFPDLWDVGNPCQVYVKYIGGQCASERGRNLCREVNW